MSGTDTLKTKIMLGVFGSVPAFDRTFRRGCKEERMVATFGERGLKKIAEFYQENEKIVDAYRVRTLDFRGGAYAAMLYAREGHRYGALHRRREARAS